MITKTNIPSDVTNFQIPVTIEQRRMPLKRQILARDSYKIV